MCTAAGAPPPPGAPSPSCPAAGNRERRRYGAPRSDPHDRGGAGGAPAGKPHSKPQPPETAVAAGPPAGTPAAAASSGEIAVGEVRACTEMGVRSVAIYSEQDRRHIHR